MKRIISLLLGALFLAASVLPFAATPVAAQRGQIKLIRDSEIEDMLRSWGRPVFAYAGLTPETFKFHLVDDSQLNAFVIGGQQMFLNTGLLMKSEHPGQVIGVMAHETGHLAGGHLAKLHREFENTFYGQIIAVILGAAAGIAAGDGRVSAAVISASQSLSQRSLFAFSRGHERSADQFAVSALESTGQSSKGLAEFLGVLESQEFLSGPRVDPYVRTHPITSERVDFVRQHLTRSKFTDAPFREGQLAEHARMKAKLIGFLEHPLKVYKAYPESDTSLPARYARTIALHLEAKSDKALALLETLLKEHPRDPFFLELKGQILFEAGRPPEAIAPYSQAVALRPNDALFRTALAAAQIESGQHEMLRPALANLKHSVRIEPGNSYSWRLLATAYGRTGDKGMTMLALAEEALLQFKPDEAGARAKHAETLIKKGSAAWIRAKDIQREAERLEREIKNR